MKFDPLYWLASYPKSGNTWIRCLLSAYRSGSFELNSSASATEYDVDPYLYNSLSPCPINDLTPEQCLHLRQAVLMHILVAKRMSPCILKTHCANVVINGVELIPQTMASGAVYVVRDPRDVAPSYAKHMGQKLNVAIATMAELDTRITHKDTGIGSFISSWSKNVSSWDVPGVTRVRYEDLKTDTAGEFRRVLETYNVKVDEDRIKLAVELCDIERLKKQEEDKGFVEIGKQDKFFGQGKGWRNTLTDNQVKAIENEHGEMMEAVGYKLEF